jgi:hypothetical protein
MQKREKEKQFLRISFIIGEKKERGKGQKVFVENCEGVGMAFWRLMVEYGKFMKLI